MHLHGAFTAVVLILIFAGSAGFYQMTSGLFYCGINASMPEILYWSIVVGCQSIAFMLSSRHNGVKKLYVLSQLTALPFLVWILAQLADTYPRPFIIFGVLLLIYAYLRILAIKYSPIGSIDRQRLNPFKLLADGVVFIVTTLLIHSAFAFLILHTKSMRLTDSWFFGIFIVSAILSYFIVGKNITTFRLDLSCFPPLFLLVFILLRSKLTDQAYDSLFYKATVPIMIADWRTALTGVIDHTLLGTNFLEIINSQIRILDPKYSPALTTAFAFIGLWIILPWIARGFSRCNDETGGFTKNAMILLMVSLTEPLTAAGTAYQEPFLILLIAASCLAGPLGFVMIAGAVSVKITTLFFVPFWILWRALTVDRESANWLVFKIKRLFRVPIRKSLDKVSEEPPKNSRRFRFVQFASFAICLMLSITIVGEQFYRNYAFTGRIFAPSEALVSITDPKGELFRRPENNQAFDVVTQRSKLMSLGVTAIHMLTLDKILKPEELGFHVFPSSRLPVVAFLLITFLMLFKNFRADRFFVSLAISYAVSFVVFLGFFSQGRHMAVASCFAVFVVIAMLRRLILITKDYTFSSILLNCVAVVVAFFAISDQMVGSYINDGWECGRPLFANPVRAEYENHTGEVEKVLASVVQKYRASNGARSGVIPSIICEPKIERLPYFGAHYTYNSISQTMLKSYFDVDYKRINRLSHSLIAICFEDEKFFTDLVPEHLRPQFNLHSKVGTVSIMVSNSLFSGAIAESITKKGFTSLQFFAGNKVKADDFVEKWLEGKLKDDSFVSTPTGKGALKLTFDKVDCGVLVSPYAVEFSNVLFESNDTIEFEYAMPYHNSDGMEIRFEISTGSKQRTIELPVSPRIGDDQPMGWKTGSVKLPSGMVGEGMLAISALSISGNSTADWVVFRKLEIQRAGE